MIDYYEILKVSPDASEETIQQRYQSLLATLHPAEFAGRQDDAHFGRAKDEVRLLNQAYQVLRDSGNRREYDRERNVAIQAARQSSSALLEELPPLQLTSRPNEAPPTPTRPATAKPRRWYDPLDPGVLAAFLAGVLIASGVLAVKYWHRGPQGDDSWAGKLLKTALARKQPWYAPSGAPRPATPAREVRRPGARTADKDAAHQKTARRQPEGDAAEGQTGAVRRERPVSVDIILAKGQQTFGAQQIGNVEVFYPDGIQDSWTTKGNCGQAHVAADGTVGWTVYQAAPSGNCDFQPNGTLVLRKRGRSIKITAPFDYIEEWNFDDGGSKAVLRSGRSSGAAVIERYDCATGRLLDSVDASRSDLPAWASSGSDR